MDTKNNSIDPKQMNFFLKQMTCKLQGIIFSEDTVSFFGHISQTSHLPKKTAQIQLKVQKSLVDQSCLPDRPEVLQKWRKN